MQDKLHTLCRSTNWTRSLGLSTQLPMRARYPLRTWTANGGTMWTWVVARTWASGLSTNGEMPSSTHSDSSLNVRKLPLLHWQSARLAKRQLGQLAAQHHLYQQFLAGGKVAERQDYPGGDSLGACLSGRNYWGDEEQSIHLHHLRRILEQWRKEPPSHAAVPEAVESAMVCRGKVCGFQNYAHLQSRPDWKPQNRNRDLRISRRLLTSRLFRRLLRHHCRQEY